MALVPAVVPTLRQASHEVCVEAGAGRKAGYSDGAFEDEGARILPDRGSVFSTAEVVVVLDGDIDPEELRRGQTVVGLLDPFGSSERVRQLAEVGATALALELLPRISRAQAMDALSSTANIAGYKSVLVAAEALDKMFPLMMTAAGTITPARVLVVGAGVAGLQAIATARRLGAVVEAYDVRPAVREQVESLGAKFLDLALETDSAETESGYARAMDEDFYRRQGERMGHALREFDVVVTTAAVPGQRAPVLIRSDAVEGMRSGAVIVDLAAASGGNCELTRPDEAVDHHGVKIFGPTNLASTVPHHASQLYARNLTVLLKHLSRDGALHLDLGDEITNGCLLTHEGEIRHPRLRESLGSSERSID